MSANDVVDVQAAAGEEDAQAGLRDGEDGERESAAQGEALDHVRAGLVQTRPRPLESEASSVVLLLVS